MPDAEWVPIRGEPRLYGLKAIADVLAHPDCRAFDQGYDIPDPLPVANWWTRLAM